jgi:LCP family protein required for cell wall assembly
MDKFIYSPQTSRSASGQSVQYVTGRRFSRARRFLLWIFVILVVGGLSTAGWMGYKARAALSKISEAPADRVAGGGLLPFLRKAETPKLKGETDNRINILLLGIGGIGHPGGSLTDTIMVLSYQPESGKLGLISLPRDLYVPIPGHGSSKLNSAHALGEQDKKGNGPTLAKTTIGTILNLPIHYFVRIDFAGFTKLIDAVGGVDVLVEKAINDPFFPDEKLEGYQPFYLKAGETHMNGTLALKYARSRETTSDFDRSGRQQQLLKVLKDKILSLGTLTNPKKVLELIEIAGEHVRTDLAVWELERFVELGKDVDPDAIVTQVLDTRADGPLTSRTDERAGYIIVPKKGNFTEVQALAKNIFGGAATAQATIAIQNASGQSQLGGNLALLLRGYGYQVTEVSTAGKLAAKSRLVTTTADTYPEIMSFFTQRFRVKVEAPTTPGSADFLFIIGQDYVEKTF